MFQVLQWRMFRLLIHYQDVYSAKWPFPFSLFELCSYDVQLKGQSTYSVVPFLWDWCISSTLIQNLTTAFKCSTPTLIPSLPRIKLRTHKRPFQLVRSNQNVLVMFVKSTHSGHPNMSCALLVCDCRPSFLSSGLCSVDIYSFFSHSGG